MNIMDFSDFYILKINLMNRFILDYIIIIDDESIIS